MLMIRNKNEIYYLIFFIATILIILNAINPLLYWDENAYLANARAHITESKYTEDFRFPLLEYLISGVWLLTGEKIIFAKYLVILISLISIFLSYKISAFYFQKRAIYPTILFSLSNLFLLWGFRAYTESIALTFLLLSFYCIIREKEFLSGVFLGAMFLSRFTFILLV